MNISPFHENPLNEDIFSGNIFLSIQCGSCGKDFIDHVGGIIEESTKVGEAIAYFSDVLKTENKLRELKIFVKMQELGWIIDY